MKKLLARHYLPSRIKAALWGNRVRWGLTVNDQDPCWREWLGVYLDFYQVSQREGIGTAINDAGYRIMATLDLTGKTVIEIGPGDIRHIRYWQGWPKEYILADIQEDLLQKAKARLEETEVPTRTLLMHRGQALPLDDATVDFIVAFYSLEHIYPLSPYLHELRRILKSGGALVGAIPAEGGLAWGGGRLVTSRRWLKKNTHIDPDKIICWEHPNFGDEILFELERAFVRNCLQYWPLAWLPHLDLNLVIRFIYKKQ